MAGTTGLEPAASAVTGQRSNQLNYVPTCQINQMRDRQFLCSVERFHTVHGIALVAQKSAIPVRTGPKSRLSPAPVPCANPFAQIAPGGPDCSQPGRNRQQNRSKSAQKYPNSFSQNTEERRALRYFFDESN